MTDVIGIEEKKVWVKKQPCFSNLSDEETTILATLLTEQHLPEGYTIVTKGDPVDSVFLIVDGVAEVRNVYVNKNNQIQCESLAQLGPENAIGLNETGFYSLSGIRTATVVALTNMTVLRLSVAAFHGFSLAYPHVHEVMRKHAASFMEINSGGK